MIILFAVFLFTGFVCGGILGMVHGWAYGYEQGLQDNKNGGQQ